MGLDVRIIAFRRHLPRLTAVDVADLERHLKATPAGPFVMDLALDDSWWSWPDKYQARGDDGPAAHVQAAAMESGVRYFGPCYHRGDWPAFKAVIVWLREHVSPDVWYGSTDGGGMPADDDLIAEYDAAWEASGMVSDIEETFDPETHCPCGKTYEACGDAGVGRRCPT